MAKILDMMDQAARRCSVKKIVGFVEATTETALELKDCLTETVEELLDRLDLPDPITKDFEVIGDGSEAYALPTDFLRLTRDPLAVVETTSNRRAAQPINDNGGWTALKLYGSAGGNRYYRTATGPDRISFYRPLEANSRITVSYVSKNWAYLAETSEVKSGWTHQDDDLLLPEDCTRLGVVWRFKQRKGLAFADVQGEYEQRVTRRINDQRGVRSVNMGTPETEGHPMRVPVPDFIPMG